MAFQEEEEDSLDEDMEEEDSEEEEEDVDLTGVREPITLVTKLSQKMSNLSCF
jgi:hypothetical protein